MARVAPRLAGARSGQADDIPSGPASGGGPSIWASIHPRLLELIRAHQSTLLFVNSRRLAERLAGALNELAGEPLVRSHHGSLAREARSEVEDLLKAGRIRALVATSSSSSASTCALSICVQIEAPPSWRACCRARRPTPGRRQQRGIIFPKFARPGGCAAVARAMHDGQVDRRAIHATLLASWRSTSSRMAGPRRAGGHLRRRARAPRSRS